MSNHFRDVCEYGTVHSQCRCAYEGKTERVIECPTPDKCSKPYVPRHAR